LSGTIEADGRFHQLGPALAVSNFRRYVAGQGLSLIGTWVETVAQGLLVLQLTHSGFLLGLTTAARYAPILLLSPYAGLLVDRFNKRRVLLVTQVGLGGVSLLLGLAVLSGEVRLWQVVVLALAFGTFSAADNPARQAFVSELVGQSLLRNAVILNSILVNIAGVIGPTIAAIVISAAGIGWCFMINAVSFLAVIGSLLLLDADQLHPTTPTPRGRGQLRDGFRYAAGVPEIIRPLIMMALVGTFAFEFEVSFPLLAHDTFQGGADAYSKLLGAFGAGAVIGGVYAVGRPRTGVVRLGHTAFLYAATMMALALAPTLWAAVGASAFVGLPPSYFSPRATLPSSSPPTPNTAAGSWLFGPPPLSAALRPARRSSEPSPRPSIPEPPSLSAHSPASPPAPSAWPVPASIDGAKIGAWIKRRFSFRRSCTAREESGPGMRLRSDRDHSGYSFGFPHAGVHRELAAVGRGRADADRHRPVVQHLVAREETS
jgi:MFS family permease